MSREEALPLVQLINQHDEHYCAEVHFLPPATDRRTEALIVLMERASRRPVGSFFHPEEYDARAGGENLGRRMMEKHARPQ